MDGNAANVVRVRLELVNALQGVVVEHSHVHIVRARNYPVLTGHEFCRTDWQITHFESFDQSLFKRFTFMITEKSLKILKKN